MFALVSWLVGNGGAPSHALVWASDGLGITIAATVLLLAALAVLVAERDRPKQIAPRRILPRKPTTNAKNDARLPRAA